MTIIKYRVEFRKIYAVEVERETKSQVVLRNGRKTNKVSSWSNWFDTWEEAHEFLINESLNNVNDARTRLEIANGILGQIRGMKKPNQ
jgi:hypothetical protein